MILRRLRALDARFTPGPISRLNSYVYRILRLPDGHPERFFLAQKILYGGVFLLIVVVLLLKA